MEKIIQTIKSWKIFEILVIIATGLLVHGWSLRLSNRYLMDDFSFIFQSKFGQPSFSILPINPYNDRPIGFWFNFILLKIFGDNYQIEHLVFFVINIVSAILIFVIVRKVLNKRPGLNKTLYQYLPLLSAVIFVGWPKSIPMFWIAAVFDLLLVFFFLLTTFFYLNYQDRKDKRGRLLNGLAAIFFLWAALRSKEAAVFIPFILLIAKLAIEMPKKSLKQIWQVFKKIFNVLDALLIGLSGVVIAKLFLLQAGQEIVKSTSSPYLYSPDPQLIVGRLFKYGVMYFDFKNDFLSGVVAKDGLNTFFVLGLLVIIMAGLAVCFAIFKKNYYLMALIMMFVLAIATVLPLANMQHILYLYFPSVFMAIFLAILIVSLLDYSGLKKESVYLAIFAAIFMNVALMSTKQVEAFRSYWQGLGYKDALVMSDLKAMPKPASGTTFYIQNVPKSYSTFYYVGGGVINIVYDDKSLIVKLNQLPAKTENPSTYKILNLDYQKGHIYESSD